MIDRYLEDTSRFMGSGQNYQDSSIIILGVPLEATVSYRPGTRFGPQRIRTVSHALEEFSIHQHRDLSDVDFHDAGDVALPLGNLEESLKVIEEAAGMIFTAKKRPIFLGGEHLISYPLIKAAKAAYDLLVVHLDAHADLREEYLGQKFSHATVMRPVSEVIGPTSLHQFGIRSGTREEIEFAMKYSQTWLENVHEPLSMFMEFLDMERPVYLSLDIDVMDPAFAPGTGTPEPDGISSRELFASLSALKGLNLVGMDLVEVSPPNDHHDITSMLAAKVVREVLLGLM